MILLCKLNANINKSRYAATLAEVWIWSVVCRMIIPVTIITYYVPGLLVYTWDSFIPFFLILLKSVLRNDNLRIIYVVLSFSPPHFVVLQLSRVSDYYVTNLRDGGRVIVLYLPCINNNRTTLNFSHSSYIPLAVGIPLPFAAIRFCA